MRKLRLARTLSVLAIVLGWVNGSIASAQERVRMRCDFYKTETCMPAECFDATNKQGVWSIVDWDKSDYASCDAADCKHASFRLDSRLASESSL